MCVQGLYFANVFWNGSKHSWIVRVFQGITLDQFASQADLCNKHYSFQMWHTNIVRSTHVCHTNIVRSTRVPQILYILHVCFTCCTFHMYNRWIKLSICVTNTSNILHFHWNFKCSAFVADQWNFQYFLQFDQTSHIGLTMIIFTVLITDRSNFPHSSQIDQTFRTCYR